MKKLILISGTMGVGKTSTCKYLLDLLQPSVWLDGDWCWQMSPWNINEVNKYMVINNIQYLLNNYIHNSYFQYILFSWVMHKQEIVDEVLYHLDLTRVNLHHFSLICDKEMIKQRYIKDNRDLTQIHRSIERLKLYNMLDSIKINTSEMSIEEVASLIKNRVIN